MIMNTNLFLINETFTNGYISNILDIMTVLAIFCAISVIVNKNPIISVLFLIGLFASISSYLIILGLNFIGLSYLIVYIGAVNGRIKIAALVKIQLCKVLKYVNSQVTYGLSWYLELCKYSWLLPYYKYENRYVGKAYGIIAPTLKNRLKIFTVNTLYWNFYPQRGFKIFALSGGLEQAPRLDQPKFYSTLADKNILKDPEFLTWFSGFVDAEGCFNLKKDPRRSKSPFFFEFLINLHIDDRKVLEYIQTRLNIGKINNIGDTSRFSVSTKSGVLQIINILTQYSLKTTKRLDFEDWQKAFQLYHKESTMGRGEDVIPTIDKIKEGMNRGRLYEIHDSNNTSITKYWLLGFIEGEGSFNIVKDEFITTFCLGQVSKDRPLLEKIVEFLISYAGKFYIKKTSIGIYDKTKDNFINQNPYSEIYTAGAYQA